MSSLGSQPATMAVVAPPAIFFDNSPARRARALLAIAGTALFNASATSNSTWALVKGKF